MIRVLIADDHPVVRRGLRQIVDEQPDMTVAAEAKNGHEALAAVRKQALDVAVLDLAMPGKSGLEALKQLEHERPELPVLILSVHPEEQYAVRVLKAGAGGYMTKETAPEELVAAIRKLVAGGKYVSASLAEKLAGDLAMDAEGPPHETLSDREFQVLRLIASGRTGAEIAQQLFLSPKTVSTYRTRLLDKMNMRTNADLIRYALKHRLVE